MPQTHTQFSRPAFLPAYTTLPRRLAGLHYLEFESGHEEAGAGENRQAHEQSKARASISGLHTQHIASHPSRAGDVEEVRQGTTRDVLQDFCQTEHQE